jgi:hypothetical protein
MLRRQQLLRDTKKSAIHTHPDSVHRADFGSHRHGEQTAAETSTARVLIHIRSEAAHVAPREEGRQ